MLLTENQNTQPQLATDQAAPGLLGLAERGLVPDSLLRFGIRRLCGQRLVEERRNGVQAQSERFAALIDELRRSPVAIHADAANSQHYELPAEFFRLCLGPKLKYSACYFNNPDTSLADAEDAMLGLSCRRAELANGQEILELGCGWGSLTLWMAEQYPDSTITAVSNSRQQRQHIETECERRHLRNVRVITEDVNQLQLEPARYDRCVSIEMFEHMRNYQSLLEKVAHGLKPGGKLFVHIFCHRNLMYPFEIEGRDNWMGRHFFTGGLMPAADTLLWFQQNLTIDQRWLLNGSHYQHTAERWLQRQDSQRDAVMQVLESAYGEHAGLWFQRWRMFWMACAELFGHSAGQQWMVAHYRFRKPAAEDKR